MTRCIIIDDERPAQELISLHLSSLKGFELLATFDNAIDAFNFLQRNMVDLIFLDIQMPRITGIEFIKSLRTCPKIILTTAYREFAIEAFELDVLDYLVKPITQERFMKAISRFSYYDSALNQNNINSFENAYIFLKIDKDQTKVYLKEIVFIEGLKDYIRVHTASKVFVTYERLSYMQAQLPENKFMRIHKSYIVNIEKISHFNSAQVTIANKVLAIGRIYKNEFLKKVADSKFKQN